MLKNAPIFILNVYQKYIRPCLAPSCRFTPSCSEYTKQAIVKYGLAKGLVKGIWRIFKCHPFSGISGFDPLT